MHESDLTPTFTDKTRHGLYTTFSNLGTTMPASFSQSSSMRAEFNQQPTSMNSMFSESGSISINSAPNLEMGTQEEWDLEYAYIPAKNTIIVITDRIVAYDEHNNVVHVPGIKIGDGMHLIPNLPYITDI